MENPTIMDISITALIIGGGIYLRAYIKKKGKNLTTKDDVEITTKIENVKHDYASRLENLKATMQAKLQIDHVRYQNEYTILEGLTEKLVELRDSAINLRPAFDRHDPNESEEDRKIEGSKDFLMLRGNTTFTHQIKNHLSLKIYFRT